MDELVNKDPDTEQFKAEDEGSFKHGIHIHSKDGDNVDIGLSGIHIEGSDGEKVRVGWDGIHVEENGDVHVSIGKDKNGHIFYHNKSECRWYIIWKAIPWPIICLIFYLTAGFAGNLGGWGRSWIIFFTIPLYYTLGKAIYKRNAEYFAYPVLMVMVYLIFGMYMGVWHPTWITFVTIPLYYGICELIKKRSQPGRDNRDFS